MASGRLPSRRRARLLEVRQAAR